MAALRSFAVLCALLVAACAGHQRAPEREAAPPLVAAASAAPDPAAPGSIAVLQLPEPARKVAAAPPPAEVEAKPVGAAPAPSRTPAVAGVRTKIAAPGPKAATAAPAPLPKPDAHAAASARPAVPAVALDLAALKTRLKETRAIGIFTKLTLQNQVEDLLDRFRQFYLGKLETSLVELRQSYDLLILKVLALLQDADPPLATAIASSREPLWGILSNRSKFSAL